MTIIELHNVWKKVGVEYILKDINLKVNEGELVCIRGKSGVGKTTLSKILSLITLPDKGSVLFLGKDYSKAPDNIRSTIRLKYIGYIPQSYLLLPDFTVYENIEIPLILKGVEEDKRRRIITEVLDILGLKGLENRYPYEISGGQQQRVAIARALVMDPKIIIADEPFSNLDDLNTSRILEIFLVLAKEKRKSIVLLTTDLYTRYPCDHDYLLNNAVLVKKA